MYTHIDHYIAKEASCCKHPRSTSTHGQQATTVNDIGHHTCCLLCNGQTEKSAPPTQSAPGSVQTQPTQQRLHLHEHVLLHRSIKGLHKGSRVHRCWPHALHPNASTKVRQVNDIAARDHMLHLRCRQCVCALELHTITPNVCMSTRYPPDARGARARTWSMGPPTPGC